jgi:hypothetical protein
MVEPVLPGARGPRVTQKEQREDSGPAPDPGAQASTPQPLFGASAKGVAVARAGATAPAAVINAADVLPAELEQLLTGRPDGPRLAAVLTGLFPVHGGAEDVFGADALQAARAVQERAAALTAEIAERDLNGRLTQLTENLMAQAAPGLLERTRRAFGGRAAGFDVQTAEAEVAALQRELKIVRPPAERLTQQAAPALAELDLCVAALEAAQPWLDKTAAGRRQRLLEAARAGCSLVPAQARQLADQLREHADRLQTLESATLPSLRNVQATRRLTGN